MRLLLDTHILIWAISEVSRLDEDTLEALYDTSNEIFFSAASIWEIAIKAGLGRADFVLDPREILCEALDIGFIELAVSGKAALLVGNLPVYHRDPFDRLLVAQAINEPIRLLTADPKLPRYSELVTLVGKPNVRFEPTLRPRIREVGPYDMVDIGLGQLSSFVGNWSGEGFNLAARPFFGGSVPFCLELNATTETLDFTIISGGIQNRGSLQADIILHGVRYLQQVTDAITNAGIHVEPGLWIHVPPSTDPAVAENYVRQSTIQHGNSLLAQSTFFTTVNGGPDIATADSTPFTDAVIPPLNASPKQPITNPAYLAQYKTDKLPAFGLLPTLNAQATIKDPTTLLRAQIQGQTITKTVVIGISTANPGALVNIPFVQKDANATQLDAIFWVETVKQPNGAEFLQLQYVQRVILNFIGISWPHISVATLKLV